jgi:monofunctional biosynthetic peptidoglycan transglycosylase
LEERDAVALEPTQRPQSEARPRNDASDTADVADPPSADVSSLSEPEPISDAAAPPEIAEDAPAAVPPEPPAPAGQPEADDNLPAEDDEPTDGSASSENDVEMGSAGVEQPEHAAPTASDEEADRSPTAVGQAEGELAQDDLAATPETGHGAEPAREGADMTDEEVSEFPSEDETREIGFAAAPDDLAGPPIEEGQFPAPWATDADAVEPEADVELAQIEPTLDEPPGEAIDDPIWQSQEPAPSGDDEPIEADAEAAAMHSAEPVEPATAVPEDLVWSQPEEPDEVNQPAPEAAPAQPADTDAANIGTTVALWQEAGAASQQDEATEAAEPATAAAIAAATITAAATTAADTAQPARSAFAPSVGAAPAELIPAPETTLPRSIWSYAGQALRLMAIAVVGYAALVLALAVLYRWVDPPTSNLMLTQRLLGTEIEQRWIPLRRISPHLVQAVILSEDGAFCRHRGVDWLAMEEAIESSLEGEARGGSTITMQLVKNLFLWSSRSYIRKAIEIPLAYLVELLWPKHRVLEIYLNIVEWGGGVFGADAAARHHFGKPASQLTQREAALLAVALPNPIERTAGEPGALTRRLAANLVTRMKAVRTSMTCVQTARRAGP